MKRSTRQTLRRALALLLTFAVVRHAAPCAAQIYGVAGQQINAGSRTSGTVGSLDPWNFNFAQTVDYGTNLALPISLTPLNTPVGPLSDPTLSAITGSLGLLNPLDPPVARFRDDFQFQTLASAVHNWNIDNDSSFSVGGGYYQSLHPRVHNLDLEVPSTVANYSRRLNDYVVAGVDYGYVYYFLRGSSFVAQSTVTTALLTRLTDWWDSKVTVSYGNANFKQTDFLSSDNYATTGEVLRYLDDGRQNYATIGCGYGYSNAVDDSFSYRVPSVYGGFRWLLSDDQRTELRIIGAYYYYSFQDPDPVQVGVFRRDNIYSISPTLTRAINDNMQLFATYIYYNSSSNVDRQRYDQSLISLGANFYW